MTLSRKNVEQWVSNDESETQEFKIRTSKGCLKEAAYTICGFYNTRGGRVLFGVDPSGKVVGQDATESTSREIATLLNEIEPPVFPQIELIEIGDGKSVVAVTVEKGGRRPYTYKDKAYRRVGSTTVEMDREAYNEMLLEELHSTSRWENQHAIGWKLDNLDRAEISRTVEEGIRRGRIPEPATRETKDLLRGLGLLDGEDRPLRAAIVLFAQSDHILPDFPQCRVRLARFKGVDKGQFIDNRQYEDNAFRLLQISDEFLRQHLPVAGQIIPDLFERQDDPIYPPEALREALANAFCHRDYSLGGGAVDIAIYDDRLEITSSGELHFGLTVDALYKTHASLPWNPAIASVFYKRGIIESWGRGTLKMAELTQKAGLPRPEFLEMPGTLTVRFRPSRYLPPSRIGRDLTNEQRIILALLAERGDLPLNRLHELLDGKVTRRALQVDLQFLRSLDLIETYGWARGARWRLKEHAE